MKTTKIKIRNLFGISETELDGKSVEITGRKGAGKTSVLDAIRLALTNQSSRDLIIRQGETEGEILIETDTGLDIMRQKRTQKSDVIKVTDGGQVQGKPETFLRQIFTPLQLDPVAFTQMSAAEKNRIILDLIDFDWDTNWIAEKFGEVPRSVDYTANILQVLAQIQAENGPYFPLRQDINREIRHKEAFVHDIAKAIPDSYEYDKWKSYDFGPKYEQLERDRTLNGRIEKAKQFAAAYDDKKRGIDGERDIAVSALDAQISADKNNLAASIERMRAEIAAAEKEIAGLTEKQADKLKVIHAEHAESMAKLDRDTDISAEFAEKKLVDIAPLADELKLAEEMRGHLNEFERMRSMQDEIKALREKTEALTEKIELARSLPGEILETATIPVAGLTVENGIPLINGLPISNLSDGELLDLCVDVTISKPGQLQIILIDGAEKLDTESRKKLYQKCRDRGLQFIATRVTDSEMEVTEL